MTARDTRGNTATDAAASDSYDVVVIGTGLGGLTAAAILARSGKRVFAAERHDRVGGYAHSFRRGPYLFDAAVHLVGGCDDGGLIDRLLEAVAVRDRCEFAKVNPCYQADFPGFQLSAPSGLEELTETYQRAFPNDAGGIAVFLRECSRIRSETRQLLGGEGAAAANAALASFPSLQRYRRATVAEVLNPLVGDARARAALTTLWPYVGLPPERLSFLYWASMLMSYIEDGAYYCKGTFQTMASALASVVRESGGEVALRSPVRQITTDAAGTTGVVLENGDRIDARVVISNADAQQTVERLVGAEHFPARFRRSLSRLRPSLSALVAYIATDLPKEALPGAHESFYFESWDHEQSYATSRAGKPSWFTLTLPTAVDPSLAPSGESLLVYTSLLPYDAVANWSEAKEAYTERTLAAIDSKVPGLSSNIKLIEVGTPHTMQRYTQNSDGAIYGWELSPNQTGPGRLAGDPPIPGLYLAGHWTQPGGGVYGVVTSGVLAARAILGHRSEEDLWRSLE